MTDLTAQEPAWQTRDHLDVPGIGVLRNRFGPDAFTVQATRTGVPVVWIKREQLLEVGDFLKKLPKPYVMLLAGCLYCSGDSHRGSRCVDQA